MNPQDRDLSDEAPLFEASQDGQIKHRDRVRDLAEVYTHEREVIAMLDLVPDMFPTEDDPDNHDKRFLEPAMGHGNFLVEILRRKLRTVTAGRYGSGEQFEHRILRCLASIYGVDIDPENVDDSRRRMNAAVDAHVGDTDARTPGFWSAVETILATNLVRADTLADAQAIELVSYEPDAAGTFVREWTTLEESEEDSQLDLFAMLPNEPKRDATPVHYVDLAANPKPVTAKRRKR